MSPRGEAAGSGRIELPGVRGGSDALGDRAGRRGSGRGDRSGPAGPLWWSPAVAGGAVLVGLVAWYPHVAALGAHLVVVAILGLLVIVGRRRATSLGQLWIALLFFGVALFAYRRLDTLPDARFAEVEREAVWRAADADAGTGAVIRLDLGLALAGHEPARRRTRALLTERGWGWGWLVEPLAEQHRLERPAGAVSVPRRPPPTKAPWSARMASVDRRAEIETRTSEAAEEVRARALAFFALRGWPEAIAPLIGAPAPETRRPPVGDAELVARFAGALAEDDRLRERADVILGLLSAQLQRERFLSALHLAWRGERDADLLRGLVAATGIVLRAGVSDAVRRDLVAQLLVASHHGAEPVRGAASAELAAQDPDVVGPIVHDIVSRLAKSGRRRVVPSFRFVRAPWGFGEACSDVVGAIGFAPEERLGPLVREHERALTRASAALILLDVAKDRKAAWAIIDEARRDPSSVVRLTLYEELTRTKR